MSMASIVRCFDAQLGQILTIRAEPWAPTKPPRIDLLGRRQLLQHVAIDQLRLHRNATRFSGRYVLGQN